MRYIRHHAKLCVLKKTRLKFSIQKNRIGYDTKCDTKSIKYALFFLELLLWSLLFLFAIFSKFDLSFSLKICLIELNIDVTIIWLLDLHFAGRYNDHQRIDSVYERSGHWACTKSPHERLGEHITLVYMYTPLAHYLAGSCTRRNSYKIICIVSYRSHSRIRIWSCSTTNKIFGIRRRICRYFIPGSGNRVLLRMNNFTLCI